MIRASFRCAVVMVLVLSQGGCRGAHTIEAWMGCIECSDGELQAVVDVGRSWLGARGVTGTLGNHLLGPPDEERTAIQQRLISMYREMEVHAAEDGRTLPQARSAFVRQRTVRFETGFQLRAVDALGAIGTPRAAEKLRHALEQDSLGVVALPEVVKDAIHRALDTVSNAITFSSVAVDSAFACALTAGSQIMCWGRDADGQLGNGGAGASNVPVLVASARAFAQVDVGRSHACGVSGQTVLCWGGNASGQLGQGNTTARDTPGIVGNSAFTSVAVGYSHTCAVADTNEVFCWGANSLGQLGDGSVVSRLEPRRVLASGGTRFVGVSAGGFHTCGLTVSGQALCWGLHVNGQLGVGPLGSASGGRSTRPVPVAGGARFRLISAGGAHTCGIDVAMRLFCWGRNVEGQLGVGSTSNSNVPVQVGGSTRYGAVSAGGRHTCAITMSNEAYCWGQNDDGQLGDGTQDSRLVPGAVSAGAVRFLSISAGTDLTCSVATSGVRYCWGANLSGALGTGSSTGIATSPSMWVR